MTNILRKMLSTCFC